MMIGIFGERKGVRGEDERETNRSSFLCWFMLWSFQFSLPLFLPLTPSFFLLFDVCLDFLLQMNPTLDEFDLRTELRKKGTTNMKEYSTLGVFSLSMLCSCSYWIACCFFLFVIFWCACHSHPTTFPDRSDSVPGVVPFLSCLCMFGAFVKAISGLAYSQQNIQHCPFHNIACRQCRQHCCCLVGIAASNKTVLFASLSLSLFFLSPSLPHFHFSYSSVTKGSEMQALLYFLLSVFFLVCDFWAHLRRVLLLPALESFLPL